MNIDEYVLNAVRKHLTDDQVIEWVTNGRPDDYFYQIAVDHNGVPMLLDNSLIIRAWNLLHDIYVPTVEPEPEPETGIEDSELEE